MNIKVKKIPTFKANTGDVVVTSNNNFYLIAEYGHLGPKNTLYLVNLQTGAIHATYEDIDELLEKAFNGGIKEIIKGSDLSIVRNAEV